jgi:hypothetical protein
VRWLLQPWQFVPVNSAKRELPGLNDMSMKTITILMVFVIIMSSSYMAFATDILNIAGLEITISSAKMLKGVAGDYVTISGQITNNSGHQINDITTYLSLVDTENKLPVDMEDWSAEKGLFIGSIDVQQTLPLSWKIHLVKAGNYTLAVIANIAEQPKPVTSTITQFIVDPKINLNPGQVLPVALGMPILLFAFLAIIQYRRSVQVSA